MEDIILPNVSTRHIPAIHKTTCPPADARYRPDESLAANRMVRLRQSTLAHALCHDLLERDEAARILYDDEPRRHSSQELELSDADQLESARQAVPAPRRHLLGQHHSRYQTPESCLSTAPELSSKKPNEPYPTEKLLKPWADNPYFS